MLDVASAVFLANYRGNTAFCDIACSTYTGCTFYVITGSSCFFQSSFTALKYVSQSPYSIRVSISSAVVLNTRKYVPFSGVRFANSIIASYSIPPIGCNNFCDQLSSCISFTTEYTLGSSNCDFASSSLNPVVTANKIGYLLLQPARAYTNQSSVNYLGSSILTIAGNMTYCPVACDALPTCIGFVLDSSSNCNFKSGMNTANYFTDPTVLSVILVTQSVNMNAVNEALRFSAENSTTVPVNYTAVSYLGIQIIRHY